MILLLPKLVAAIDSVHRTLISSAKQWKKTGVALIALARQAEISVNRMMGYREDRPPRPAIDATVLAGDVLLYWMFSGYWFALGSLSMLLIVVKQPHQFRLIALAVACTLFFYVIAAIYRNLGTKKWRTLANLFRAHAGNRPCLLRMSASIATCMLVIAAAEYFALPYMHSV
ncbi:hypothetical protein [Paraburkholderia sp. J12]|uniref:hypothetical protein n=1 Tax=Paraburkholderia sp. J12 TaxID=2805432 RepID=UPI002ABD9DEE|nr:hypothetical protein [Paraburkholderia sp. J12]